MPLKRPDYMPPNEDGAWKEQLPITADNNDKESEDNFISTQEMIIDSRARRQNSTKEFNCEHCKFKSGSVTLIDRHTIREHSKNKAISTRKEYKSKRINCQHCEQKFNKNETFQKHMEKIHKDLLSKLSNKNDPPSRSINEHSNVYNEVQPRVTRSRNSKT